MDADRNEWRLAGDDSENGRFLQMFLLFTAALPMFRDRTIPRLTPAVLKAELKTYHI